MSIGKRIQVLSAWRSHQVIQRGREQNLEGFASPDSDVHLWLLERAVTNGRAAPPRLFYCADTLTTAQGHFVFSLPAQKGGLHKFYILLLHVTQKNKQPQPWPWLLEHDADDTIIIDDLVFGDVWFFTGGAEQQRTLQQCKDYRYVPFALQNAQTVLLDFVRLGCLQSRQLSDFALEWYRFTQRKLEQQFALYYYFALHYSQKMQVPIGIIDMTLAEQDGLSFLRSCQDRDYFQKYFQVLEKHEICGFTWYFNRNDMLQMQEVAQFLPVFWSYLSKYINQSNTPCLGLIPQLKTIPYFLQYPANPCTLLAFNLLLKRMLEETNLPGAVVPTYDLSLHYMNEQGSGSANIPLYARKEGERLSSMAQALYVKRCNALAPRFLEAMHSPQYPQALVARFVDFHLALQAKDKVLDGFLIAGAQGDFQPARARIIHPDSVLLWHPDVPNPKYCGYAYYLGNEQAGLQDHLSLPALPFITKLHTSLPAPQPWLDFSKETVWGMRSNKSNAATAMPCELALYRFPPNVQAAFLTENEFPALRIQEGQEILKATAALQVTYRLLSKGELQQTKEQRGLQGQVLWSPAGFYFYPCMPNWSAYRALTVFVYNPDPRRKKLYLNNVAMVELNDHSTWQAICFRLPQKLPVDTFERALFLVEDEQKTPEQTGNLLFARLDLWQNENLAQQYVNAFNQ